MADILRSPGYRSGNGDLKASLPDIEKAEYERSLRELSRLHAILDEKGYAFAREKTYLIVKKAWGYQLYHKSRGFSQFPQTKRELDDRTLVYQPSVLIWIFDRQKGIPSADDFA